MDKEEIRPIEVLDSKFDLNSTLTKLKYSPEKITELMNSDVLLLPIDLNSSKSLLRESSVSLKKAIDKKLKITVVTHQESRYRYLALRSAEILVPMSFFIGYTAFDIGKGIVADWLSDQLLRFRDRVMKPNAKFECLVMKDGTIKEVKYEGPAEELPKILRSLKID